MEVKKKPVRAKAQKKPSKVAELEETSSEAVDSSSSEGEAGASVDTEENDAAT